MSRGKTPNAAETTAAQTPSHDGIMQSSGDSRCPTGTSQIIRWLRSHWFRIAIAAFALAATLVEWSVIPPIYPLNFLFSGLSVIAIILSPFIPRTSGWVIIITVVARLFVLDLSGPNPLWAAYLALAIIGYDSTIPVAIAALLTVAIAECVPVALNTFNALSATWIGMVNYIGMFTLATMGGMSFRWRKQRDEIREQAMVLERKQWQLDTLQRNTRLASRIHDSASGGLSYIALTAQRELRRIGDDASQTSARQDWQFVNDQALSVLDEIHHVIDLLEQPQTESANASAVTFTVTSTASSGTASTMHVLDAAAHHASSHSNELHLAADQAKAKLQHLGFQGTLEIRGEIADDCAGETQQEAANLLGEIAANITRHMAPEIGEYCCAITLGGNDIEIMETNPIAANAGKNNDDTDAAPMLKPHGKGLAMHRSIIQQLGGELNTTAEDGDWILYARIPTHPSMSEHPQQGSTS
ncbi:signal transduction histidine kinase-like protein [Bifidobacterium saguini DSM 23967]|uniref:Signal transduction histidine kinase-like protein n=2 Tax=Bifidobacterium saguini TaxID=762210 RepID=A0A087D6Q4_9BIFI|nr:hypothetical protein [Bifidobacterium saguini]KFI91204.1 signal transduction histidine kinase-like protein [Bifidobacterium saguini DSM 23967]QTB91170.1 hypothetical protein BSD967_01600 [Bifidobacterium saguini]